MPQSKIDQEKLQREAKIKNDKKFKNRQKLAQKTIGTSLKKQLKNNDKQSRQIAGKYPPLTRLMHIGIETEIEKSDRLTEFFSVPKSALTRRALSVGF